MKSTGKISKGIFTIILSLAFVIFTDQAFSQSGTWTTETPMPTARYSLKAAPIGGLLYVAGGHAGGYSGASDKLEFYNPETDLWGTAAPLLHRVYICAGGVIDDKFYIAGGWDWPLSGIPTRILQIYNPAYNSWNYGADMPILNGSSTSAVINRKLYVLTAMDGYSGWRKWFHVYDPDTNSWTSKTQPTYIHSEAATGVIDGKLYVAGGYDGSKFSGTLEVYDPEANSWTTKAPMPTPRQGAGGAVIDGKFYVVGGYDGTKRLNIVEVYDPVTNNWTSDTSMPTARCDIGTAVINGLLYGVGGSDINGMPLKTLEVFTPTAPNRSPVAVCKDVTVSADSNCTASASIDNGSYDPDGDPITLTQSPTGPYPLGNTLVTLTVSDDEGALSQCTAMVTVRDTTPPTITCPANIVKSTDFGQCSAVVDYAVTANDNCAGMAIITSPPSGSNFPKGTTAVTATATDLAGNTGTCTFTVTVEDKEKPTITGVTANPSVLWPPNHKMVPVVLAVSTSDNCDPNPVCRIITVSSNEPENGLGDGDTAPDWEITGDLTVNLRAERSGTGSGRVYTIMVQCTDTSGNNSTPRMVTVTVPHDQRKK